VIIGFPRRDGNEGYPWTAKPFRGERLARRYGLEIWPEADDPPSKKSRAVGDLKAVHPGAFERDELVEVAGGRWLYVLWVGPYEVERATRQLVQRDPDLRMTDRLPPERPEGDLPIEGDFERPHRPAGLTRYVRLEERIRV
jgi:hypothetical protein